MGMLFDAVRERVTALEAAKYYGLDFRGKRAKCPWTPEHRFNLSFLPDGRCNCFACHSGGSAIDLTAQLFSLTLPDAAKKLNEDFHLGIDEAGPPPPDLIQRQKQREEQKRNQEADHAYLLKCIDIERESQRWLNDYHGTGWDDPAFMTVLQAFSKASMEIELYNLEYDT